MRINNTTLEINLAGVIDELLSSGKNSDLLQSISCNDNVIQNVVDQIIHGMTTGGYSGSENIMSDSLMPLQKARQEIALSSSQIANDEIDRLKKIVAYYTTRVEEYHLKDDTDYIISGYKWISGHWEKYK